MVRSMAKKSKKSDKRSRPTTQAEAPTHSRSEAVYGEVKIERGSGGETHQTDAQAPSTLTTQQGVPISDGQNTLAGGERGPQMLEDFVMREKIFHFDHERIPERVVHARGYGAKGTFETYDAIGELTCADLFQRAGEKTDVFTRFSTVAGSAGSPDLARDVRGFAVKFYTREGNWDLVGNNMPVFFIQDAIKFPDLIHSVKPEPDRGFPQAQSAHDNFWDFVSLMPEATHMLLWAMSDRAIPRSLRFMEGFGVHTFRFVNSNGESKYVKFHWKPLQGVQSVIWDEAVKINGVDPDFHRRDMWDSIERGDFPEWELGVQVFDDDFADSFPFDILDATKLIPEEDVPVRIVGKMTLNRNVDNFFAETEQVAFCTSNIVRGIDFTNDPLLQGRNFSYLDTQLKRLGSPNFAHIPVNAPRCPVMNFQRDGHMTTSSPTGRANYEPNSWGDDGGPRENPRSGFVSVPANQAGEKRRVRPELFADHYSQARQFYNSQNSIERSHISEAFAFELSKVDKTPIVKRMIAGLRNVDEGLAQTVAEGLGLNELPDALPAAREIVGDLKPSKALDILALGPDNFGGRKIGVLVAEGSDAKTIRSIDKAAKSVGAVVELVAPTRHGVSDSDGKGFEVAEKIDGGPSVLFDAIAVVLTEEKAEELGELPAARDFVADAHAHSKFVAYGSTSISLLEAAGVDEKARSGGYHLLDGKKASAASFIDACVALRYWNRHVNAASVS